DGFLLLEEPELSLNEEIVRNLPLLIDRVRRSTKRRSRQILISTHSQALLENKGIDPRGVLRLERIGEGTSILAPTSEDMQLLTAGLSAAEVLLPKAHPHRSREMAL
ncbi:MAG: AAA family ATPase, partial [Rhodoblastus sp.]|nr:AAA family ATPase [Rhodoblastus sp.]